MYLLKFTNPFSTSVMAVHDFKTIIRQKGKFHLNLIMQIKCANCGCLPQECIDIKSPRECSWKHKKEGCCCWSGNSGTVSY